MATRKRVSTVAMGAFVFILIIGLTLGLVFGLGGSKNDVNERTFRVDHDRDVFLLNGEPFRYVSGSFHYFRALPEAWQRRLRTMRSAGLNVVDTYVEWALHNPHDGVYNWEGIANVEHFIELANDEGFYVILRPGPYICAERDNGGLPHWLFTKYPKIQLRTSDANYHNEVAKWYAQLMTRMQKFLYGNGGPIIMVQVENEYGSFHACDRDHLNWLRDETEKYVQGKALLFTTDIPNDRIDCGKIDNVFATTDFGIDRIHEIETVWKILRSVQPTGPLVNSEFYPGWLTHWQEDNQRRDGKKVANSLRTILDFGASVNFYMFFGGTNFGFTAGANDFGFGNYTPDITSYDYDAVMDEAGGITPKFELVRDVIADYLTIPDVQVENPKRLAYGEVKLMPILELLSEEGQKLLAADTVKAELPLSFEALDKYSGLVLYETQLPKFEIDPTLLTVAELHDRAFVFVDQRFIGTLSRENNIYSLPLNGGLGSVLQLLVENQGRINFNIANDTKGIMGPVTLQRLNGDKQQLFNWNSRAYPLEDKQITQLIEKHKNGELNGIGDDSSTRTGLLQYGPVVYIGEFTVPEVGDTYLNVEGWGKGVAYINGFNLGRYWPLAGPQITLYVPNELLRVGKNEIAIVEYQRARLHPNIQNRRVVQLDAEAQLDA